MMLSKDATRIIGKIVLYLPLIVISLILANAVSACPEKRTSAAYRTKAIKTRSVAYTSPTVITYRAPASYRLCGDTLYDTRNARYVATRSNIRYNSSGARYVAVRRAPMRYVAVRDNDAPRYVAVRRAPTTRYVAVSDTRPIKVKERRASYVEMRNGDRYYSNGDRYYIGNQTRYIKAADATVELDVREPSYVAVRSIKLDNDAPRYVAVRRAEPTRYVAVRSVDVDQPRYVAVQRSSVYIDEPETRYVAVSDGPAATVDDVVLRDTALPAEHVVEYSDANFSNNSGGTYLTVADNDDACLRSLAVRTSPEMVTTRTVSYIADDDIDDYAFLRPNRTRYVAASELTRPESYIRVDDDDEIEVEVSEGTRYLETNDIAGHVSYVPVDDRIDSVYDDDIQYVAARDVGGSRTFVPINAEFDDDEVLDVVASDVNDPCARPVAVRTCSNDIDTETVSYVPASNLAEYDTVSYVPVNNVYRTTVSDTAFDDCPMYVSSNLVTEPVYIADNSTVFIDDSDMNHGLLLNANTAARTYGYRDGLKDGQDAALHRDVFDPADEGDYENGTNGYEGYFGDKDLYKEEYRAAYLSGYQKGYNSVGGVTTVVAE